MREISHSGTMNSMTTLDLERLGDDINSQGYAVRHVLDGAACLFGEAEDGCVRVQHAGIDDQFHAGAFGGVDDVGVLGGALSKLA